MLLVNEILHGRYRIVRQLGQGGMGAVYEAHDNTFDTTCAIKEIMIDTLKAPSAHQQELIRAAFEREAKLLAKIKHEVVPHVRDYFSHDNRQFLVMELVEGKDLGELLEERKGPFPMDDVMRWTEQLLDALDYLHTQNPPIYHRDIKPQNLKLTPRGKIKLLDFGIAKGGGPAEPQNASTVGNQTFVAATLNYSPIEQTYRVLDPVFREVLLQRFEARIKVVMEQNADARSDIYALGATAYHLLTGTLPIDSLKRTTEVWSGKQDPLANPTTLNPSIPAEVSRVLLRSMEIDRDHRYPSAIEMQQELFRAVNSSASRTTNPAPEAAPTMLGAFDTEPEARIPATPSVTDAPTVQIPSGQLNPQISEQTIASPGHIQPPNQFNTGGQQPASPFSTGGQQPASPFSTGGQQPASPFSTGGQQPAMPFSTGGQQGASPFNTGGQQPAMPFSTGGQAGGDQSAAAGAPFGGQQFAQAQQFNPAPVAAPKKRGRALLIVIPLLALLFLAVGGAGAGYWIWTQSQTPTPTPTASPTATATATPAATASPSPTDKGGKTETPSPTPSATPVPNKPVSTTPVPIKTPAQVKTPRPKQTPKKKSDCIFTGDC
jgi:serine/threonine protein kinase